MTNLLLIIISLLPKAARCYSHRWRGHHCKFIYIWHSQECWIHSHHDIYWNYSCMYFQNWVTSSICESCHRQCFIKFLNIFKFVKNKLCCTSMYFSSQFFSAVCDETWLCLVFDLLHQQHSAEDRDPVPLSILHMPVCITFGFFDEGWVNFYKSLIRNLETKPFWVASVWLISFSILLPFNSSQLLLVDPTDKEEMIMNGRMIFIVKSVAL